MLRTFSTRRCVHTLLEKWALANNSGNSMVGISTAQCHPAMEVRQYARLSRAFGWFSSNDSKTTKKYSDRLVDNDLLGYLDKHNQLKSEETAKLSEQAIQGQKKKFLREDFAFSDSMKQKVLKEAKEEFDEYKARYKYMPILDELLASNCLKAVLAVRDTSLIDPAGELPAIIDHLLEKVFQFKAFENITSLFAVMMRLENINEEANYTITSAMVTWASKVSIKELVGVLALVPNTKSAQFTQLFGALEEYFVQKYTNQSASLTPADMIYILEMLLIYRRVDPKFFLFVENMEEIILDKLETLPAPVVTALLKYFLEVIDIAADRRESTLQRLDKEMLTRARYLGEREVLKILFLLAKFGKGSDLCINVLLSRLCGNNIESYSTLIKDCASKAKYGGIKIEKFGLNPVPTLSMMNDAEIKMLTNLLVAIQIAASLSKIDAGVLLECLFTVAESQVINRRRKLSQKSEAELKEFFTKGLDQTLKQVYLLSFSQLTRLWSVNLMTIGNKTLQDKLCERLEKVDFETHNLPNLDLKDFSFLIWTLSSSSDRENLDPIFNMFEETILAKRTITLREVSYVLWAVVLKFKIQHQTFHKLVRSLEAGLKETYATSEEQIEVLRQPTVDSLTSAKQIATKISGSAAFEESSSWEIMNLVWGLSKFESDKCAELLRLMTPLVLGKLDSFSATELLMVLRVYAESDYFSAASSKQPEQPSLQVQANSSLKTQQQVLLKPCVDQLASLSTLLDQDHIDIFMYLLLQSPLLRWSNHAELLRKLFNQREELKKKVVSAEDDGKDNNFDSAEEDI